MNTRIKFKIFDKTFQASSGLYGKYRFNDPGCLKEVADNYGAIKKTLQTDNLLILKQVHGNAVIDADLISDFSQEPEADAAVCSKSDVILSIQTADCVPVLLASETGEIFGAAHCGWRSARDNILESVIQLMTKKGATQIAAVIGPAIQQASYEVDQNFYDQIVSTESAAHRLFIPRVKFGKFLFDLPGFVSLKLKKCGVLNIINLKKNTYSDSEKYYSYRREKLFGTISDEHKRILSVILRNC